MDIKKTILISAAVCFGLTAAAVPARKGVRTFLQADGTEISLYLVGDEFQHTFATLDGLSVMRCDDGNFHYRTAAGVSGITAHNSSQRTEYENEFISLNVADISVSRVMNVPRTDGNRMAKRRMVMREQSQVPNSGSPRVPVLLLQYKDYKFKDSNPNQVFKEFFETGSTSARQYFVDQSNGKYTPEFDVYGPYTLSGNRSVYGGNDYYGDDKGVGRMVGEGCQGLNPQIDFSRYDNDGDGECDVVIVLYAGNGEASSYDEDCENAVWPCQWNLTSSDFGKSLTLDGTKVDKFAVFNELNGADMSRIDGIGTFCHEFSHCLGLPDFYDTEYGPHFGMGPWSLMDYGPYNNDGYTPIGYSAYEKSFMGWIDIEEGEENTQYTLPVFNSGSIQGDRAVRLTNPADPNEYFILENRACQGWDEYMPAEGLMISHVTYNRSAWSDNVVNNYDMQRMTLVPADGDLKLDKINYEGETYYTFNEESLLGDLWPYGDATELTDTSTPAVKLNSGRTLGKPVTEIVRNDDGTVSFWLMKAKAPSVAMPVNVRHKVESETSATVLWDAGDDTEVTYTVEVKTHRDITYELVISTDFTDAGHGWTASGFTETTDGGTRLGSSKQQGKLISPSFTTDSEGSVTVMFRANYYSGDESGVKVSLTDAGGNIIDTQTLQLTARPEDYKVLFNGRPETAVKVSFETVAQKKRLYMLSADIYTGDAMEMSAQRISEEIFARTLTGITGTSVTITDLPAKGVYDYRVKAVPTDAEAYTESNWSDTCQMDLSRDTTGMVLPGFDSAADEIWYTLQGIRLAGKPDVPGIFILMKDNSPVKVMIGK